jgi:predicted phosphodiesterase
MAKLLVIGDTHIPACHPGYLAFVSDLYEKYDCDTAIHIGDVADWHSISRHEKEPEAKSAEYEYTEALGIVQKWYKVFPKLYVCEGNHDRRIIRAAAEAGIPKRFIRTYNEFWETPKWKWALDYIMDDVYYFHGSGVGGVHPAYNIMSKMLMSVCLGHVHTAASICWKANPIRRIFGLSVGCGVDDKCIAFNYAENYKIKSVLSAATVLDGIPYLHIMPVGRGEKYEKKRFK